MVHVCFAGDEYKKGVNLGVKFGGARLIGEWNRFAGVIEFDNGYGSSVAAVVSKYISPRLEMGLDVSYSTLKGKKTDPLNLSAQGIHAAFPFDASGNPQVTEPVEYHNKLLHPAFFVSYYLTSLAGEASVQPFVNAGYGYLSYNSRLMVSATKEMLFGKGIEGATVLSTGALRLGFGFNTRFSSKFYLKTSVDFVGVNYDFLDVVHNYDPQKNRLDLNGVFTEIRFGIFFTAKKAKYRRNTGKGRGQLPFAR